ncbi:hypothetical protein INR49_015297 [Caranx melampygus]|nr:hypothetical protein INR49_015297 [Caranx melampygus]
MLYGVVNVTSCNLENNLLDILALEEISLKFTKDQKQNQQEEAESEPFGPPESCFLSHSAMLQSRRNVLSLVQIFLEGTCSAQDLCTCAENMLSSIGGQGKMQMLRHLELHERKAKKRLFTWTTWQLHLTHSRLQCLLISPRPEQMAWCFVQH